LNNRIRSDSSVTLWNASSLSNLSRS